MKKSMIILLTVYFIFSAGLAAFAAQDPPQADDGQFIGEYTVEEAFAFQSTIDCYLSEPVLTRENGAIMYTTTLFIKNMSEFYGYQIQVVSPTEDMIEIENKTGGVVTPTVHKNGKTSFATIVGESASGDIEVCTITSKYPYADKNKDRMLVVDQFEVVTSIAAERTIAMGSPALTLKLPYAEPPFFGALWFALAITAALISGGIAILFFRYKKLGLGFISGIQADFSKALGSIRNNTRNRQKH